MTGLLSNVLQLAGGQWQISFTTRENPVKWFYRLKDSAVEISIKKWNQKRSKSANDFLWAICTDIGNAIKPPIPKEEVYRRAIRDVGVFEPLPILEEAVERFSRSWSMHGIGWFVDVVDDSKLPGYKKVFAYYGSSTYTTTEMSRLIDYLLQDMRNMELPIPISQAEYERLLKEWGKPTGTPAKKVGE